MRLRIPTLRRVVKGNLQLQFVNQEMTSYGGLELLRRYFRLINLHGRVRQAFGCYGIGGDYGCVRLLFVVMAFLLVGGRRLQQLRYISDDPLVKRLCGLRRIPTERTVVNWLKQFTGEVLKALISLNRDFLYEQIEELGLSRLTIDVDGTVINTGGKVGWAFRGFSPHRRKDPSYYPLLAHLAQTGQIVKLRNRPGNVHDSRGAERFLRELIGEIRTRFGCRVALEFRMDAAFFQRQVLRLLEREGCEYAIKVGFWKWLDLKSLVVAQKCWRRVSPQVEYFVSFVPIEPWGIILKVVTYRKRVRHKSPKNFQLDLFSPDDGYFEYSAIATNKTLSATALWDFMAGRGAQEKTLAELKGEFALDVVPTHHYGANSAWQQISILAHNLLRGFQLKTLASPKPRSRKRTYAYLLHSMRTLRFVLIHRAGRLTRIGGPRVLRMTYNPATQQLYDRVIQRLAA